MIYDVNYLEHHGIKGQKWGVRRFQEEDGSLTAAGRDRYGVLERYKHGRELNKELNKAKDQETDRLQKQSKKYQDNKRELERITSKYGLDPDTGEEDGFLSKNHSKEDLRRAKDRYWQLQEDKESLDMEISEKALKSARKHISERYGDTALSDVDHYNKTNRKIGSAFMVGLGAVLLAATVSSQASNNKARQRA